MKRLATTLSVALVLFTATAQAWAQAPMKPIVVVSLAGYNEILKDVGYVGKLAEMPDLGQSVEGLIGFVTQFQGLVGLDKTKPIGVAINTDGTGFPMFGFLPVTDLDKLLGALAGVVGPAQDVGDGIKSITVNRIPLLIKPQAGWAYISISKESFANLPADPSTLLGDLPEEYDLGVRIHVQNVPQQFRDIAVQQIKQGMQQGMKRLPNENDDQFEARRKMADLQFQNLGDAINELDQLTFGFGIDSVDEGAYFDVTTSVVPGKKLAQQLAALENVKTKHAGFLQDEAIMTLHTSSVMMEADINQILAVIQTGRTQVHEELGKDGKLSPEDRQKIEGWVGQLFDVGVDTVKGGSLNFGGVSVGEGPKNNTLLGSTVVGGGRLEKTFKDFLDYVQTKPEFAQAGATIKYDAGLVSGVKFHQVTIPIPGDNDDAKKARELLGDKITITAGFSDNRVYLGSGQQAIATAKTVIDESADGGDEDVLPFEFSLAIGPIVRFAAMTNPNEEVLGVMAKALADGDDVIGFTMEVDGLTQAGRLDIEPGVIRALGLTAKTAIAKKQQR